MVLILLLTPSGLPVWISPCSLTKSQSCKNFLLNRFLLPFHNPDLIFRQPIQFIHQRINLFICCIDLALDGVFFGSGLCSGLLFVQFQHFFH